MPAKTRVKPTGGLTYHLVIKIEFNDRYAQAGTYHQLGMVAEELREFTEARRNYEKALEILIEFKDKHNEKIVRDSLTRLDELEK